MAGIQVSTALKKTANSEDQLVKPSESISNTCPPSYAYIGEGLKGIDKFCSNFQFIIEHEEGGRISMSPFESSSYF